MISGQQITQNHFINEENFNQKTFYPIYKNY